MSLYHAEWRSSLNCAIYISLTAASLVFVQESIVEYLEGKTYYHSSKESVTAQDIPTFTTCIEYKDSLEYDEHFRISMWFNSSHYYIPLSVGHNVIQDKQGTPHHLVLKVMNVGQYKYWIKRKCFKVSRIAQKLDYSVSSIMRYYGFGIDFVNTYPAPLDAGLYITSEENAYGATFREWYNGRVEPYFLKNQTEHYINLEVTEYRNQRGLCQEQSYYQCLTFMLS